MTARRPLAIVTTRRTGRTHVLAAQRPTVAELAARGHDRLTLCGRLIDGRAGEQISGGFGTGLDCLQCTALARSRGWVD